MTLREYLDGLPSIKAWAEAHRLNPNMVIQIASEKTRRKPGPKTALAISKASGGLVPLSQLRPDLWG